MFDVVEGHTSPGQRVRQPPSASTSFRANANAKKAPIIIKGYILRGTGVIIVLIFQVMLASTFIVYQGGDVVDPAMNHPMLSEFEDSKRQLKDPEPETETPKAAPIPSIISKDGKLIFNPEEFRTGNKRKYVNIPLDCPDCVLSARKSTDSQVAESTDLEYEAHSVGNDVIICFMTKSYRITRDEKRLIDSLRHTGFDGHVILGVKKDLTEVHMQFLKANNVTVYKPDYGPCEPPANKFKNTKGRSPECYTNLPTLPMEWGQYELARQWIHACKECTGRVLLALDGLEIFFQTNPFDYIGGRTEELFFTEELAAHTNPFYYDPAKTNVRHGFLNNNAFRSTMNKCYPGFKLKDVGNNRPLLVPSTVLGSLNGIDRYLAVMVDELKKQVDNGSCHYPMINDVAIMNYLYYSGFFGSGETTTTMPWGHGVFQTLERPCRNQFLSSGSSRSQLDMVRFDFNITGYIANRYEVEEDGSYRAAPVVHRYENCDKWVQAYLKLHGDLTGQKLVKPDDYLDILKHTIYDSVKDRSDIAGGEEENPMKSAYQKATVVQQAPWFPSERKCKKTCCAQAIAISLDADTEHLITTVDGLDLSDVQVLGHGRKGFLEWAISDLTFDVIPCLQKGTIIYADHEGGGAKRFFEIYRPRLTQPYLLVTGGSDGLEPVQPMGKARQVLENDKLLIGWYGINPCYRCGADHPKFHMMHLGLSALYDHQKFLTGRLKENGFHNPFVGARKSRWTDSVELATAIDSTNLVFVKFGINAHSQHRYVFGASSILCKIEAHHRR
eukprot:scaffold1989_cov97-Cylindrotheca_fusiformis.AAC.2